MHAVFQRIEDSLRPLDAVLKFCEDVATPSTSDALADGVDASGVGTDGALSGGGGRGGRGAGGSGADSNKSKSAATVDPMEETYHLMELQKRADAKFSTISDPALAELAIQASRLSHNKMSAYWDLLSLQDPFAPPAASKRPKAYSVSIKEYALVEPLGTGGFGTVWLARRRRTGDLSAIKVLSQEDMRAKNMGASVRLEKTILELADHPYGTRRIKFPLLAHKHRHNSHDLPSCAHHAE